MSTIGRKINKLIKIGVMKSSLRNTAVTGPFGVYYLTALPYQLSD